MRYQKIIIVSFFTCVAVGIVIYSIIRAMSQNDSAHSTDQRSPIIESSGTIPTPSLPADGALSKPWMRDPRVLLAGRMYSHGEREAAREFLASLARDGENAGVRADAGDLLSAWIEQDGSDPEKLIALLSPIWLENSQLLSQKDVTSIAPPELLGPIANRLALAYSFSGDKVASQAIYEAMLDHPDRFPRSSLTTLATNSSALMMMAGDSVRAERLVTRVLQLWETQSKTPADLILVAMNTYLDPEVRPSSDATAWLERRWSARSSLSAADQVLTGMAYARALATNRGELDAADVTMETISLLARHTHEIQSLPEPLRPHQLENPTELEVSLLSSLTGAASYGRRDAALWAHNRLVELAKSDTELRQALTARDAFLANPR